MRGNVRISFHDSRCWPHRPRLRTVIVIPAGLSISIESGFIMRAWFWLVVGVLGLPAIGVDDQVKPVDPARGAVVITRDPLRPAKINPYQYGQFIEYLCNLVPAMWAEKLFDGSFEGLEPLQVRLSQGDRLPRAALVSQRSDQPGQARSRPHDPDQRRRVPRRSPRRRTSLHGRASRRTESRSSAGWPATSPVTSSRAGSRRRSESGCTAKGRSSPRASSNRRQRLEKVPRSARSFGQRARMRR